MGEWLETLTCSLTAASSSHHTLTRHAHLTTECKLTYSQTYVQPVYQTGIQPVYETDI